MSSWEMSTFVHPGTREGEVFLETATFPFSFPRKPSHFKYEDKLSEVRTTGCTLDMPLPST